MRLRLAVILGRAARWVHRVRLLQAAARWIPLAAPVLLAPYSLGQQTYVGRWDAYGGYTRLMQPSINLAAPGFNLQVGMRLTNWVTVGFDYTIGEGRNTVEPGMLLPSVQNGLNALLGEPAAMVWFHLVTGSLSPSTLGSNPSRSVQIFVPSFSNCDVSSSGPI